MHNIKGSIPCGIEPFIVIINIISSSFDFDCYNKSAYKSDTNNEFINQMLNA